MVHAALLLPSHAAGREVGSPDPMATGGKGEQHRVSLGPFISVRSVQSLPSWCNNLHQPWLPPHLGRGSSACDSNEDGEVGSRPRAGSPLSAAL